MWFKALYLKAFLKFEFKKTATQTPTHKNLLLYKVGYLLYLKVRFCTVLVFFAYSLRRKYCHFIVTLKKKKPTNPLFMGFVGI